MQVYTRQVHTYIWYIYMKIYKHTYANVHMHRIKSNNVKSVYISLVWLSKCNNRLFLHQITHKHTYSHPPTHKFNCVNKEWPLREDIILCLNSFCEVLQMILINFNEHLRRAYATTTALLNSHFVLL